MMRFGLAYRGITSAAISSLNGGERKGIIFGRESHFFLTSLLHPVSLQLVIAWSIRYTDRRKTKREREIRRY
jgi:hypothetical protein